MDAGTESDLMEVMEQLTAGRTTIMIAHRLHTLRHCDLQLVLCQGRIVVPSHGWVGDLSNELVPG
ncbi:MAG TPA: hypothetical protein VJL88_13850 [Nitrospira sp.]|nr:hypothetical protein [Nitrospira sp.]